jgi:hypothetical protein
MGKLNQGGDEKESLPNAQIPITDNTTYSLSHTRQTEQTTPDASEREPGVFREYHIVPHSWGSKEISM